MNSAVIKKLIEILPTLYLNKVPPNYEYILFKSRELVKNLSNTEKIKLYQTQLEINDATDIIELCILIFNIWEKDYGFNKKDLLQKKEFIEIYLKDVIPSYNLKLAFDILENIRDPTKYLGKYEILKDLITDVLNLELISLNVIDKLIIDSYKNNSNYNISKLITKRCKEEIFKIKESVRTSYAKEIAINSEKQLKLIVLNPDFLSNHVKTRVNVLKNSSYFYN
tara:strand:+ start:1056 stop:1727 length:672 start_codon:yes stop_codon:yes gene_type:complete